MKLSQIRQDRVTRQWVIYAPTRSKRPRPSQGPTTNKIQQPAWDKNCPFCPGNEHLIPSIIGEKKKGSTSWQVRVVPNKFPIVTPAGKQEKCERGVYCVTQGYGYHEVIIETPIHNRHPGLMSSKEVGPIIDTYHDRYVKLMKEDEIKTVFVFRNHGLQAGTSLIHPHSQVIAMGMIPDRVLMREQHLRQYYYETGRCGYCEMLESELRNKRRLVGENQSHVAWVPFAAEAECEIWVMPKKHQADFANISNQEKKHLASLLHDILVKFVRKLRDPDYNYVINSCAKHKSEEPYLHWYLRIKPQLTKPAGFEIGSGISVNPSFPEKDAKLLRKD